MHKLDEELQHWGVKGMKWGVIRWRKPGGSKDGDNPKPKGKLRQKLDSMKRERQWKKVLQDVDNLSSKEISTISKRLGLENDLKSLSKGPMGTAKDKQDYIRRATMTNDELSRKVTRLRAKETLYKKVNEASAEQRALGTKIVQISGALGTKFAIKKKLEPADIFDTIKNPKKEADNAKKDILNEVLKVAPKETHDALNFLVDQMDKKDKKDKS